MAREAGASRNTGLLNPRLRGDSAPPAVCVATVTTPSFLPGTLVTLGSFLARHPGFDGDLVVIHDRLPEEDRKSLGCLPRLRFEQVSPELGARLARLTHAHPALAPALARFHSLEAFRLRGYSKVLFLDSDLLFRKPVDDLFDRPEPLICCGDGPFYRGNVRDAETFNECPGPIEARALERPFNAGFLLIDAELLRGTCYADLLSMVTPESWRHTRTPHTDQILYNRYFDGRQTLVGATYDYLLAHAPDIRAHEGLSPADARVLHFNMRAKPWQFPQLLRWAARPGGGLLAAQARCFGHWYDAYRAQLVALHLHATARRAARRGRRPETSGADA